jgi:LuxR family transcriptional regulator, maltose regulon positive regulatory protein
MSSLATPPPEEGLGRLGSGDGAVVRGLLDRELLLQTLDRALTKRVTVISAPPGSGKTSLLRAWAKRFTGGRVAFVTVDRNEQDAPRFWGAVLDAVRWPAQPRRRETQSTASAGLDEEQLVGRVLAELAEQTELVVLIIDDLHELRSSEALAQLDRMLTRLPNSASVVLSSRRDPPVRLHQLRLADGLAEIRADDLRFTELETRALLAAAGITLSDAGTTALLRRTEGWAAGLRLAVISLNDHPDPERFVAEFSGTDRAIGEYLMAEMLERQSIEVQDMLLRTSLVDRLNGELADLLTGRSGCERMLLELEDANAFVVSLDAERTWFRYHQLLADFLRLEFRRRSADELGGLHRRAAGWLADQGSIVEAVEHRLAAGDRTEAARLVADHSFRWVLDGQTGTIDAALQSFPAGASAEHPDLALAHAAAALNRGWLEDASAQLALAESHLPAAPPARRRHLTVAIAALRLAMARRNGQFTEVIEQVELLNASIADDSTAQVAMDTELRAVALLNLGIVETWSGRLDDADRHLSEAALLAQVIGRPYLEVGCRAHQGFPSKLVSVATAYQRSRETIRLAEQHGLEQRPILAPAIGTAGAMAIWMGEFDEGEAWLQRASDLPAEQIEPAARVLLHLATGMLHAGRGEHRLALEQYTDAARAQSLLTGSHALAPQIAGWLASANARLGMLDEARATLAAFPVEADRKGAIANAYALVQLTEGDPAEALRTLEEVPATQPVFNRVETHLLVGIAHLQLGDRTAAAAAAEAALRSAEPDRLIFPFAMTGAAALLDTVPHHGTSHAALLADIVELLQGDSDTAPDRSLTPAGADLSPSELRVLRYLPTNLTRPEIAAELFVSVNTVNTHIRNIYSKLGARDRSSAVDSARQLRLLSTARSQTPSR